MSRTTTPEAAPGNDRSVQNAPLGWPRTEVQVFPASNVTSRSNAVAIVMSVADAAANRCGFGEVNTGPDGLNVPPRRGAIQTCLSFWPGPASLGLPLHSATGCPCRTRPRRAEVETGHGSGAGRKWTPSREYQ